MFRKVATTLVGFLAFTSLDLVAQADDLSKPATPIIEMCSDCELNDSHISDAKADIEGDKLSSIDPNESWPTMTDESLPMAGIFIGNYNTGLRTGNSSIALESARRFRAEKTGYVDAVRYQNRTISGATEIEERCNASPRTTWCTCADGGLDEYSCGYALNNSYIVGNGGSIVVQIQEDDGTDAHLPTGVPIGRTKDAFVPLDNKGLKMPTLELETPTKLTAGKIYHLVYKNLNPPNCELSGLSAAEADRCPRNAGAISLNGVQYSKSSAGRAGKFGPFLGDSSAVHYRDIYTGKWTLDDDNLSWYEIRYTDGSSTGDVYTSYDSLNLGMHVIGGPVVGRQLFTANQDQKIDGIWLSFGHKPWVSDQAKMNVSIKDPTGTTLSTATLSTSITCLQAGNPDCRSWEYSDLTQTVLLRSGDTYIVELQSTSTESFNVSAPFAMNYNPYNALSRNNWTNAHAEISTDGGNHFRNWSSKSHHRDISMLLTIVGMPKQLR